jgi:hypothetical protein
VDSLNKRTRYRHAGLPVTTLLVIAILAACGDAGTAPSGPSPSASRHTLAPASSPPDTTTWRTLISYGFSKGPECFVPDEQPAVAIERCTEGEFRILRRQPGATISTDSMGGSPPPDVVVTVDVRFVASSATDAAGVGCLTGTSLDEPFYIFAIGGAGTWGIARRTGSAQYELLTGGRLSADTNPSETNHIIGRCSSDPGGTSLVMWVNGVLVGSTQDQTQNHFAGVGLFVVSDHGGADARFDNEAMLTPNRGSA